MRGYFYGYYLAIGFSSSWNELGLIADGCIMSQ